MSARQMTPWELRGYLTYPNQYGKPRPGTSEEINWSKGWAKAQAEAIECQKSDYHLHLEQEALLGRDSFFANYDG
jgi:hypothetical protein